MKRAHQQAPEVELLPVNDDGMYPNNQRCPVLVYRRAFDFEKADDPAAVIESTFERNQWTEGWRNGVYDYHHYHSTAHEVLGCYAGHARLQLGGGKGLIAVVARGDAVVIPAGVAHRRLTSSTDFRVVGCYANGESYDMNYGESAERPAADGRIAEVQPPRADPVYGPHGPLMIAWGLTRAEPSYPRDA